MFLQKNTVRLLNKTVSLVWLTNDLSVVVASNNFHGFLIDRAKLLYIEISFVSLQEAAYFSSRLLNLFRNHRVQGYLRKCQ